MGKERLPTCSYRIERKGNDPKYVGTLCKARMVGPFQKATPGSSSVQRSVAIGRQSINRFRMAVLIVLVGFRKDSLQY